MGRAVITVVLVVVLAVVVVVVELVLGIPPALGIDDADPIMGPVETRRALPVTVATGVAFAAASESGVYDASAATRRVSAARCIVLSTAVSAGTSAKTLVVELTADEAIELGLASTSATTSTGSTVNTREKKEMPRRRRRRLGSHGVSQKSSILQNQF